MLAIICDNVGFYLMTWESRHAIVGHSLGGDYAVRRAVFLSMTLLAGFAFSSVHAQPSPSADQIISSMRPTGNLTAGGVRGIRLSDTAPASSEQVETGKPHPYMPAQSPTPPAPGAK
jgi:hypothetical protein